MFYTPTFIVRVIVRRTVGPLLAGKTVREVAGRGGATPPLRIADIACGSGTFLLEVYQYLLDWYLEQYVTHLTPLLQAGHAATSPEVRAQLPEDAAPAWKRARKTDGSLPIYEAAGGEWRLTTAERKRILTTHIYGVDIDPQAVEVTKLSLLLKVLEGESEQTLGSQLRLFQERALPDLARNIKCGNSLIGPEFRTTGSSWACWTTRSATGSTRSIGPRSSRRCSPDKREGVGQPSLWLSTASTPSSATRRTSASRR